MFRKILSYFTLPLLLLLSNSSGNSTPRTGQSAPEVFNPGPDIIAGNMEGLYVDGITGTQHGLAIGVTSCNTGNTVVNFFAMPGTNHPAIAQNLYRMSGGPGNTDRFEQIGQAWVKHTYGAKQANDCSFGCQTGGDFNHLGVGCSDTYFNFQSAAQGDLGSRAWINPFTGVFQSNARNHSGHNHSAVSHMIVVENSDLNPAMNPGASYYAELLYVTPDEFAWCQTHPGECNMYNNSSYRRYTVSGTTNFFFSEDDAAVRMTPPLDAWTGATINTIEPAPGIDGRALIAYKVTGPVAGVWHYEYAIYNQNLDRGIRSFSVPLGCGIPVSNLGFHAPPNHPGFPNDGTLGDAGFSNAAWSSNQTFDAVSWSTETFAQNQNANAIRWGTLYNFRFDSDKPPLSMNATIGFFKTGTPITVGILGPNVCNATPPPTPTATPPSPTPTATATATPPNPIPTATPSATPGQAAQPVNLSTRMRVQPGDNAGIAGFIITGSAPKHVLLRAIGPSLTQFGVPNVLADPVMELHGPGTFVTITNDNWRDDPVQAALILATGIPPTNDLESAIDATLPPGNYTAVVRGRNDTSGAALVEVYDLDQAGLSKLGNISTRAFVSTGDNIVIAGFILGNNAGADRVIVRGLGPSRVIGLANLANPTLELRNSNGALLRFNNDWQDDPVQAAEIAAAGLAPTHNLEAAIAATLPPGLYTALLSGVNNGTGVGLVEVYDLGNGTPPPTPTPGTPTPSPTASPGITPSPTQTPIVEPCIQGFDGVAAPNLPPGWTAGLASGDPPTWQTSAVTPDTPPNDVFVPDQDGISDKYLISRNINVTSASATLSFRNNFNTQGEGIFGDGYVLEVSSPNINGGTFTDVTDPAVGGSFVTGGYTGIISNLSGNPLAGRMAWSGNSGGYINTVVNLGPTVNGQTIKLRFRMGTDEAVAAPGVRIDTLSITGASCP